MEFFSFQLALLLNSVDGKLVHESNQKSTLQKNRRHTLWFRSPENKKANFKLSPTICKFSLKSRIPLTSHLRTAVFPAEIVMFSIGAANSGSSVELPPAYQTSNEKTDIFYKFLPYSFLDFSYLALTNFFFWSRPECVAILSKECQPNFIGLCERSRVRIDVTRERPLKCNPCFLLNALNCLQIPIQWDTKKG